MVLLIFVQNMWQNPDICYQKCFVCQHEYKICIFLTSVIDELFSNPTRTRILGIRFEEAQNGLLRYLNVNTTYNSSIMWNYRQTESAFWTQYLPTVVGRVTPTYPPTTEVSGGLGRGQADVFTVFRFSSGGSRGRRCRSRSGACRRRVFCSSCCWSFAACCGGTQNGKNEFLLRFCSPFKSWKLFCSSDVFI